MRDSTERLRLVRCCAVAGRGKTGGCNESEKIAAISLLPDLIPGIHVVLESAGLRTCGKTKPEIERLRGFGNEAAHLQYVCSVSEGGERSDEELADFGV